MYPYIVAFISTTKQKEIRDSLQKKGHKLDGLEAAVSQGIEKRPNGELWANSDYRKGGQADGY